MKPYLPVDRGVPPLATWVPVSPGAELRERGLMFDKTREKIRAPIERAVTLATIAIILAVFALIAGLAVHAR